MSGDWYVSDGKALVHKPQHLAALLLALPPLERRVVVLAVEGGDAPALALAIDVTEEEAQAMLRQLVCTLRITGWDDPVLQVRPVRRALERIRKKDKQ